MIKYCYLNGHLTELSKATLHITDLSVLRGYGIFDFLMIRQGQPTFIEDYLNRFFNSSEKMRLPMPFTKAEIKQQIMDLIAHNGLKEAGMKLVLTGGYSDDGYAISDAPNFIILQIPRLQHPIERFEKGVKLLSHAYVRTFPFVKTTNYLMGIRNLQEVKAAGAIDLLFHQDGKISETAIANFFFVDRHGVIKTAADKILHGITRSKILEIATEEFEIVETNIFLDDLKTAKEAFITSSTRGVMPVVQVDERIIGNGKVGPISLRLNELYGAMVKDYLSAKTTT